MIHFVRKGEQLATLVTDAVPRVGDAVTPGARGGEPMKVWGVTWRMDFCVAYVELKTEQEYEHATRRPDDPAREAERR
jgi:hypothetical protein